MAGSSDDNKPPQAKIHRLGVKLPADFAQRFKVPDHVAQALEKLKGLASPELVRLGERLVRTDPRRLQAPSVRETIDAALQARRDKAVLEDRRRKLEEQLSWFEQHLHVLEEWLDQQVGRHLWDAASVLVPTPPQPAPTPAAGKIAKVSPVASTTPQKKPEPMTVQENSEPELDWSSPDTILRYLGFKPEAYRMRQIIVECRRLPQHSKYKEESIPDILDAIRPGELSRFIFPQAKRADACERFSARWRKVRGVRQ
jgi:hypothetical protein